MELGNEHWLRLSLKREIIGVLWSTAGEMSKMVSPVRV